MTSEQWSMVEAEFAAASEAPPALWPAKLAAIQDVRVREEVASLLQHAGVGAETLGSVIGGVAAELQDGNARERRIGAFRVVRRLGMGGQGAVFEAVRDDGSFQQRVAIKIVKWEIDSPAARLQFRHERQILAGLAHPNIARLLDGGETGDGIPYIVMELIDGGVAITKRARTWTLQRKLELFLKVIDAVAYAHRNLVVHRDLKPGNILVTADGAPKVLDFGIARLLDHDIPRTSTGLWAMTPDYASPEQIRGLPISTASDEYSLGVVLYELLTDRKPYDVRQASPTELDRVICQRAPDPPGLGDELDDIILMALRKEPERRYSSVEHFGDDIRRFLTHQPVVAKPDTLGYRARKFVRRHSSGVVGGSILVLALAGSIVASQYQARRAQHRFEQVRHLANTFVFAVDDSVRNLAGSTTARQLIVKTGLEYLDSLAADAGNDVGLKLELAGAYEKIADVLGSPSEPNLGRAPAAIENYNKSRKMIEAVLAVRPKDIEALRVLAHVSGKAGDLYLSEGAAAAAAESFEAGRKAIEAARSAGVHDALLEFLEGGIYMRRGDARADDDLAEATRMFELSLAAYQRAERLERSSRYRRGVGVAFARVGRMRLFYGHTQAAVNALEESLRISRELSVENPHDQTMLRGYAIALMNSGDAQGLPSLINRNDPAEALRRYRAAKQIADTITAKDAQSVLGVTDALLLRGRIGAMLALSNPAEAIREFEDALRLVPRLGDTARRPNIRTAVGLIHQRLALAHLARKEYTAGLKDAREAVALLEVDEPSVSGNIILGDLQKASGRPDEAVATWERSAAKVNGSLTDAKANGLPASDLRDIADLFERLADHGANPCPRYRRAMDLLNICVKRGVLLGERYDRLTAKAINCEPKM